MMNTVTRWSLYSNKIANDKFDGTKGFNIEGGLKDASYVPVSVPEFVR